MCCTHAFHHVPDVKQLTLALSRRVKPNGVLLVIDHQMDKPLTEVLDDAKMKEIDKVVAHKHGKPAAVRKLDLLAGFELNVSPILHYRFTGFTQQALQSLLEESGRFNDVTVEVCRQVPSSGSAICANEGFAALT